MVPDPPDGPLSSSRRYFGSWATLLVLALLLFTGTLLATAGMLNRITGAVVRTTTESGWDMFMARFELGELVHALDLALPQVDEGMVVRPADQALIARRFDLFWSRIDILHAGENRGDLEHVPNGLAVIAQATAMLGRHEAAVASGSSDGLVTLRRELAALMPQLHEVMLANFQRLGREHSAFKRQLGDLGGVVRALVLGVVTSTAILVFLLLREVGRARQLLARTEESARQIEHLAHHDPLTGLANRRLLAARLEDALAGAARRGTAVALHLVDVDNFKDINDQHGHARGDALLRAVATRMGELVRTTDTISRLGGDEFAVVQTDLVQPTDAEALAERLLERLSEPYRIDDVEIRTGVSIGVTLGPADGATGEALLGTADMALYRAKADGRGRWRFFDGSLASAAARRRRLRRDLARSIDANEFELHYQPQQAAAGGELVGAEALLRWHHRKRGLVPAIEFIDLAAQGGLVAALDRWVIDTACRALAARPAGAGGLVALNLSVNGLRDEQLPGFLAERLARHDLAPGLIELEIGERFLLEEDPQLERQLETLHGLGLRLAIDGFGNRAGGLNYLRRLSFDTLKLGRSLVARLDGGRGDMICGHLVKLAHGLGLRVVAEGIETERELGLAKALGCDALQGYLIGRPAPVLPVPPHPASAMTEH